MRIHLGSALGLVACSVSVIGFQASSGVQEFTHLSQVMGGERSYRVFFPASYAASQKRYPVLYWLHGYESSAEVDSYSRAIAAYVATHDLLVVDTGPVETTGVYPLYFPELADHIDRTLRTAADRGHRGLSGFSAGGFMAFYLAGKYPDLVSSASSFMGPTEYAVGPRGVNVEYCADDFYANFDGVRTRLVTGSRDFIQFYHRRLNAAWVYAKGNHETEDFDADHGTPGVAQTLDFHMRAFANPLPKPAVFTHADAYPNFSVWGWEVVSDRRQPGYTVLENVSASGFRSAVREWIPGGAAIPQVKLSIESPKLYAPRSPHTATIIRLRDGKVERRALRADADGKLSVGLDGDAYEVGISAEGLIAVSGYEQTDVPWVTAGQPAHLRVKFWNKGGARTALGVVRWESSDPGVHMQTPPSRLFALAPGESMMLPLDLTVQAPARPVVRIFAVTGAGRLPFDVPVFPAAEATKDYRIADGKTVSVWQHGVERAEVELGEGNGDGYAAPGETFALLLPDGDGWRATELFGGDACLDLAVRASDSWVDYDHTGASAKYTLATIRNECQPGKPVRMLARMVHPNAPNHSVVYQVVEFPIWYRRQ
ncbi:MAG TPA: alpha/beta hydrolase-fold protein [Candidatus Sulfopaludibacter sp.]|nr:alpha/beta hydrolase-fold protein [Candidatus Sulfopaludibacter sp.]